MNDCDARRLLREMFDAAVSAADPTKMVPVNLPKPPRGRTVVVGDARRWRAHLVLSLCARTAGGRPRSLGVRHDPIDDRAHKLLGTREWFVIHHTNSGMEIFTDEVIADLLEDDLATASELIALGRKPEARGCGD
jgi:carbonic anhydrase